MLEIDHGPEGGILEDNQHAFAGLPVASHWTIHFADTFGFDKGLYPNRQEAEIALQSTNGLNGRKFVRELLKGQQYRIADGKPDDHPQYIHEVNDGANGSVRAKRTTAI